MPETIGSPIAASKYCPGCRSERPFPDDFYPRVDRRPGRKPGYQRLCKACSKASSRTWQRRHPERRNATRRQAASRDRTLLELARSHLQETDPSTLDALRRALVEKPPEIDADDSAIAYFRGFLAGAGRARSEAEDVEAMKDLVFRIASQEDHRMRSWRPDRRLSFEDMVSVGYEALLECLRKKRRERPLVAQAIRRRFQDEARERFGRQGQATEAKRTTLGRTNFDDDEGQSLLGDVPAEDGGFDHTDELLETALARIHDHRTRDVVVRRSRGETLAEIGAAHGLSESRICMLMADARPLLEETLLA